MTKLLYSMGCSRTATLKKDGYCCPFSMPQPKNSQIAYNDLPAVSRGPASVPFLLCIDKHVRMVFNTVGRFFVPMVVFYVFCYSTSA